MVIQLIVEGHGEVEAARKLLGRVLASLGQLDFRALDPIRVSRDIFLSEEKLKKYLELARRNGADRILAIYDADDDCAVEAASKTRAIMQNECPDLLYEAVAAVKEYEAWLLAGSQGLLLEAIPVRTASYAPDPEQRRYAKKELAKYLGGPENYSPTVDQLRLTQRFDLDEAKARSRSFRAFCSAVQRLSQPDNIEPILP